MKIRNLVLLLGLACFSLHSSGKLFAGTKQFSETTWDWAAKAFETGIVTRPDASTSWKDSGFTDNNWNVGGNWYSGSAPGLADSSGATNDSATFLGTNNLIVTVDATRSIGTIQFDALASAFTLQGGHLYLANSSQIYVELGGTKAQTVFTPITLSPVAGGNNAFYDNSNKPGANLIIAGSVTAAASRPVRLDLGGIGAGSVSGAISDGASGGILALQKATSGTWTLTGTNTYTGTTTITSGTLQLGNGGISGSIATASAITNNSVLIFNRSNSVTQGSDFSGSAITGTGNITKLGGGALTLNASNTYQGGTSVQAGTLLVNNVAGSGTGTGPVTVSNTGSILGGTGAVTGAVTIGSGAFVQAGSGSAGGSLTLSGALSLSSNSLIQLALGPNGAHSTLARTGSGSWMFATGQTFSFLNLGATQGTYQDVITGLSAAPNTNPSNWTISNPGWHGMFVYDGAGHIDFVLDAIASTPEPGTWVAGALALGALAWRQARKVRRMKDELRSGRAVRNEVRGRRSVRPTVPCPASAINQ